jgi:hypothetical protein
MKGQLLFIRKRSCGYQLKLEIQQSSELSHARKAAQLPKGRVLGPKPLPKVFFFKKKKQLKAVCEFKIGRNL